MKFIPTFFRKDSGNTDGKAENTVNQKQTNGGKDNAGAKTGRMNRNLLISQRNLSILSESNETADELNSIHFMGQPFDGPGYKKNNTM